MSGSGKSRAQSRMGGWIGAWTLLVIIFLYLPVACGVLASLSRSRYFGFPIAQWSMHWWQRTLNSIEIGILIETSVLIALMVTVVSVVLAFMGALAFARYDWRGRKLFQRIVLLPIFFPQAVLGLALLLWFNTLGLPLSWKTAVFAHLVLIVPIVTLIISIQVYSFDAALEEAAFDLGATRWQVLREVTLPVLWPGIFSGSLFAFLLSWGNFPLSLFTTGADSTLPEWLYAKMVSGYSPLVPTVGMLSVVGSALIVVSAVLAPRLWRALRRE